ncbi:NADPH:adrenodoxin oxidoreductase, mitochondrial [Smittium mucronatum]|uniref:NADPH:adrenodoxin oxidoreductase, mitochondrial n=1 Tax=Smittium mucronatum TaxID=133383 RepID=A0A1R0H394_9FUNG|nr:NADPH:adrenodoxin oxidoreductase, mitochondrial [Smittium mucronatum]
MYSVAPRSTNAFNKLCRFKEFAKIRKFSIPSTKKDYNSETGSGVFNVAVVGSGAAGFYTTSKLLDLRENINVDIFEIIPAPYGLVRYGVAPDHPEVKVCINKFETIGTDPRVRYFGNVGIGNDKDVSVNHLRSLYDVVVLSQGTSRGRVLNIPGEEGILIAGNKMQVGGIHSGRDFVNFYNGYPDSQNLFNEDFLSRGTTGKALLFGVGNVSLDVARILLSDVDSLSKTDITERALEMLSTSTIDHVDIFGRRGSLQSSFTTKELRELLKLPRVKFDFDYTEFDRELGTEYAKQLMSKSRQLKRKMDLIKQYQSSRVASSPAERLSDAIKDTKSKKEKSWSLKFFTSPTSVEFNSQKTSQIIKLVKNRLDTDSVSSKRLVKIQGSEFFEEFDVAFKSIGYESTPIDDVPFDSQKKIIPNVSGRVYDPSTDSILKGLYVSGWAKTGPTGVLANTMQDAYETAFAINADIQSVLDSQSSTPLNKPISEISEVLLEDGIFKKCIDFSQWLKIKDHELNSGNKAGKLAEKVTDINEMLEIAKS